MEHTKIARVPISPKLRDASELTRALMEEADQVLGLSVHQGADAKKPTSVLPILADLSIAPLDPAQVRKYQQSKEVKRFIPKPKQRIGFWMFVSSLATLVLIFARYSLVQNAHRPDAWTQTYLCLMLAAIVGSVAGGLMRWDTDGGADYIRSWCPMDFTEYYRMGNHIPEFVIARAVEVKKAIPSAVLQVEYLRETTDPRRRRSYTEEAVNALSSLLFADPFLVLKVGSQVFYLDVWDEPDFERHV